MKKILILAFSLFTLGTYAQREVPQSRMEQIYEEEEIQRTCAMFDDCGECPLKEYCESEAKE